MPNLTQSHEYGFVSGMGPGRASDTHGYTRTNAYRECAWLHALQVHCSAPRVPFGEVQRVHPRHWIPCRGSNSCSHCGKMRPSDSKGTLLLTFHRSGARSAATRLDYTRHRQSNSARRTTRLPRIRLVRTPLQGFFSSRVTWKDPSPTPPSICQRSRPPKLS